MFLCEHNLIDYSLLLTIENRKQSKSNGIRYSEAVKMEKSLGFEEVSDYGI